MRESFADVGSDRLLDRRIAAGRVAALDEEHARERRHPHAAVRDRDARRTRSNIDREQRPDDLDRRAGSLDSQRAAVTAFEFAEEAAAAQRHRRRLLALLQHVETRGADKRGARMTETQRQRRIGRRDEAVRRATAMRDDQHHCRGEREGTGTAGDQPAPGRVHGLVEAIFDARPDLRAPDVVELVTGRQRDAHELVAALDGSRGIAQGVDRHVVATHDILASRDARP